jgi:hypothetical protein
VYRTAVRRSVMTRSRRVNAAIDQVVAPADWALDSWNARGGASRR